jgi:hypothetical protein
VIRVGGTRIAVAVAAIVIVGGSLTGCARIVRAEQQAPAAGVAATTTTPTSAPASGVSDSTLQTIQGDLNSTDSATSNADGDVTDADTSAATNDSP